LSLHVLERSFGHVARVLLAPDMALMLGMLQRPHTPEYGVVCISRNDPEGIYGPTLAVVAGLTPLRQVQLDLGEFDDRLGITANAAVSGSQLLLSDWYQMRLPDRGTLDAHQRLSFDQRSGVCVSRAIRLLSFGRVVVTDRLHGHILCTLAGILHVLLNNSPPFPVEQRRAMGWFNDFSKLEIIAIAGRAGFVLAAEEPIPPDTTLFAFDPRPLS
jgi:exopolysaccharide biosynthesis predicted pyruvyltransferase EpsI